MTVQADLEILRGLAGTVDGLADDAGSLVVTGVPITHVMTMPFGGEPLDSLRAVTEAVGIAVDATTAMSKTLTKRFEEIGALMRSVAIEFENADDSAADAIASVYTTTSGLWEVPPR